MLVDAHSLPDGSVLEADLCIVGAGPAGLSIARELGRGPLRVCVVESGGTARDPSVQELSRLAAADSDITPASEYRRRQFGGNAHYWTVGRRPMRSLVRHLPLDPIDFEPRAWVQGSGWPIVRTDLDPYYARAHRALGLGEFAYELPASESARAGAWSLDDDVVRTSVEWFGTARPFLHDAFAELSRSPSVTVLLRATAAGLDDDAGGERIERLRVDCLNGAKHTIAARAFVLAAGGVENPRLLLVSSARRPEGIGNRHDQVGRYFMDHLHVHGTLVPRDRALFERAALYDVRRLADGRILGCKLNLTEGVQRREGLLNSALKLEARLPSRPRWSFLRTYARFALKHRQLRPSRFEWSTLGRPGRRFPDVTAYQQLELPPDPDTRVTLGAERDRFGRPLPAVRWKWDALTRWSVERTARIFADAFASAGIGSFEMREDRAAGRSVGINHHIGTTRMHADPTRGVVDADCRVHGVANLFVAGSSVFPTGGYANPTLTIVALAIRLADHLRGVLSSPP